MRSVAFLLCGIAFGLVLAAQPTALSTVQSVYLFPMASGLDQFLANRLTNGRVFQVVADPKKADAVFTDRLGEAFEARLDELYLESAAKPEDDTTKEQDTKTETKPEEESRVRFSSFGRGKGNIFLVDRKTRSVIWSTYEKPKNSSPEQLDRAAQKIAGRLKHDLTGK